MANVRIPAIKNQALISLLLFCAALWLAWESAQKILVGDWRTLELAGLGVAALGGVIVILQSWRLGFYFFLIWMLVEDLVRKYMGNGTVLFFGKDILLGFVYLSLYLEIRRGKERWFRAPFLLFLSLFFWLAVLEVFNPYSPSVLYGLLGLKLYFYYVPLIYVGYALVRNESDLRKFLYINVIAGIVIPALGIVQAIRGNSFLNPAQLAPSLQDLGNLQKVTPLSGQIFNLPDSVFVSAGRFTMYLVVAFVIAMGAAGYFLMQSRRRGTIAFIAIGTVGAATLLCGNRGAVLFVSASVAALCAAFVWGAPWQRGQPHRLMKAIRRSVIVAALGLAAVVLIFPNAAASRLAFYSETLLPDSSAYMLSNRAWDYPLRNFLGAFNEHWVVGAGTGTASLGTQYVSQFLGQPRPNIWVEEGFGDLIVEMGILAPLLWIAWGAAVLYFSWKVVRRLRGTRYFPLAIVIFWYAFLLIFPMTYGSLAAYQDFVCSIYMWLMLGVLYRLPELAASQRAPAQASSGQIGELPQPTSSS